MNEGMEKISSRHYWKLWLVLILVGASFGAGLFLGKVWQMKDLVSDKKGAVEITKVLNLYSKSRSSSADFEQFWALWNKVKEKFVDQPVDDVKLFYGALQGVVSGLGDPYSMYFPPKQAEEFAEELSGEFEGIGAEIGIKENQLVIIAPLSGSPAEKAGIKSGDKIYLIDGEETYGLSLDKAVAKIRGPKGTAVKLTISHDGLQEVQEITIVRDTIVVPNVTWEIKDKNIAYLRVSSFNDDTWDQFDKAIKEIKLKSAKGIVLDLRSNPGGYLDTAISVASEWIKSGNIVTEKFSGGRENNHATIGAHRLLGVPTAVLVDGGSASASEIVAGALQDYGVAKLIGAKTYGKGSVQDFEVLPDGSALKLTVARWYTPKDRQIDKEGIMPDVVLDKMVESVTSTAGVVEYKDLGLEKAIEILTPKS
ncbi:MAG: S41 family peptidase [Candidatus Magasanikbacteria bacterium]|nr:S41 family peptidase [Candidatus Magasanikbacteria bacterium]